MGGLSGFKSSALGVGVGIGALNWINPAVGVATVIALAVIVLVAMAMCVQVVWVVRKPDGESRRELKIKGRIARQTRAAPAGKQTGTLDGSGPETAAKKSVGKVDKIKS